MPKAVRIAIHALLFLLAFVAFYAGLVLGLQYDATLGTILWIIAFAIGIPNLVWFLRWRDRQ